MGNSGGSIVSNDYSVQSLIRSIGDPGASPSEKTGATLLKRLDIIDANLDALEVIVRGLNPDTGTEVSKSASATNQTTIVHTVTAGQIFYLTAVFGCNSAAGVTSQGRITVRNASDVEQYEVMRIVHKADTPGAHIFPVLIPPFKIPAGYDVCVISGAALFSTYCNIHGWEEPV